MLFLDSFNANLANFDLLQSRRRPENDEYVCEDGVWAEEAALAGRLIALSASYRTRGWWGYV
jgi:hypothetical protein